LAPWHLEQAQKALPPSTIESWAAIPNFVDTDFFHPAGTLDEKRLCREALGIPVDAFVVGTVAALKRDHKRIDYLIEECAAASTTREELFLVLVGSRQSDTEELLSLAESRMPNRVVHLVNVSRDQMPNVYRCFDVFVLASLVEMMPIALLEAMASGLPSILNSHDVLEWMCGHHEEPESVGGVCIDMSMPGELSRQLSNVDAIPSAMGGAARLRAQRLFATEVVIQQYIAYYQRVVSDA
jgi:1,2-diacylglycerol 3-alpha-glucosyltransferase